jgi:hypothetical protein
MSFSKIVMPVSSRTSRAAHCSKLSPNSRWPPGNAYVPFEIMVRISLNTHTYQKKAVGNKCEVFNIELQLTSSETTFTLTDDEFA